MNAKHETVFNFTNLDDDDDTGHWAAVDVTRATDRRIIRMVWGLGETKQAALDDARARPGCPQFLSVRPLSASAYARALARSKGSP